MPLIGTKELARELGYSTLKIKLWAEAGIIPAIKVTPRSQWRFDLEEVKAALQYNAYYTDEEEE